MRKLNLDILRIVACFLVIVNHTNSDVFLSMTPSLTWFASLTYFFLCKMAVPLFVMISGALLLKKQEEYKTFFMKRIFKVGIVLLLFSFVYYVIDVFRGNQIFSLVGFGASIYKNAMTNAYWYLYLYLGILLMLPILRKLVVNLTTKDYIYYFSISTLILCILPLLEHYFSFGPVQRHFALPIFSVYITYFLLGHFIENVLDKKYFNKKVAVCLLALGIVVIASSTLLSYYEYSNVSTSNYLYLDNATLITTALPTAILFYLCKYWFGGKNGKFANVVSKIAVHTFGIYLVSDFFITELLPLKGYLKEVMQPLVGVLIFEVVIFILGFITAWIMKKIPLLKKIV